MKTGRGFTSSRIVPRVAFVAVAAGALGTIAGAQINPTQPQPKAEKLAPVRVPTRGGAFMVPKPEAVMPTTPGGFTVSVYAELQAPRMMVYAPNGDLFVSSPAAHNITVLRDANNDGVFEERGVYAQGEAPPRRGGGAAEVRRGRRRSARRAAAGDATSASPTTATEVNPAINGPILGDKAPACAAPPAFHAPDQARSRRRSVLPFTTAFSTSARRARLIRYKYTAGDLQAQGPPEKLLDLPGGGHSTRNIVFNRAGTKMYLAVGSQSNNTAGEDCRRAAILEFNPDGTGYRVYASGIRNPVGLALQPGSDIIWTAVNERDNLGDDLVPDYATSVKDGGFYGWPYSYIGSNYDPRYVGAFPDLVKRAIVPDVLIPAHSAALGITFYDAHAVSGEVSQRRLRCAARLVESSDRRRVQGGVFPDDQRPSRSARGLPDRLRLEGRRRGRADGALGPSRRRHRRARRQPARLGRRG